MSVTRDILVYNKLGVNVLLPYLHPNDWTSQSRYLTEGVGHKLFQNLDNSDLEVYRLSPCTKK